MRVTKLLIVAAAVVVSACGGGSPSTPTAPTSTFVAPPATARTIQLLPTSPENDHGFFLIGTTFQTRATCREGGRDVSCTPAWSSTGSENVIVDASTGLLTFRRVGSSTICVQWSRTESTPRSCAVFSTRAISSSERRTITMLPAGGTGRVGTTLQTRQQCAVNGESVICFTPHWWTLDTSTTVLSVEPNTGLVRFLRPGRTQVCLRWSEGDPSFPWACHDFTTTP